MTEEETGKKPAGGRHEQEKLDLLLLDVSGYGYLPPLGLLYIATCARAAGFAARVQVLQGIRGGFSRAYLRSLLERFRPAVVGLPVTAESLGVVEKYCRWLREDSAARLLVGGPEASAASRRVFDATGADALIVGDGEERTVALLRAWRDDEVPADLRGILLRRGDQILHDPRPPAPAELESLPFPDFSLMLNRDSGVRTLVTGRGCPFRCTFCFEGRSESVRLRPVDDVLLELDQLLVTTPARTFAFLDDTFTLEVERTRAICAFLRERFSGPWFCEGRIGVLHRHPEIIAMLAEAGLTRLQLGLESGSQRVLDAYRKDTSVAQIREVFRLCHDAGITSVIGNFIVGGAFESDQSFRETLQLARDLVDQGPGSAELLTCYIYPYTGTAIQEAPQEFGLEFLPDLPLYNAASRVACVNRTASLSRGEISQYKTLLQLTIHERMLAQIDALEPARIERHLRFARDNSIYSEWYQIFLQCRPLALYARLQRELSALSWSEIAERDDWLDYCPIRVSNDNLHSDNGELRVQARREKEVRLAGMARHLFELSAGKLSLEEMLPYLRQRADWGRHGTRELLAEVRRSCELLGRDFLLLYRDL